MKIEILMLEILMGLKKGKYTRPELELILKFSEKLFQTTEKILKEKHFEE